MPGTTYKTSLEWLLANADIWEDLGGGEYYIGYAGPGSPATSATNWDICKVAVSGAVTTRKWADGIRKQVHEWDERANYTYKWLY